MQIAHVFSDLTSLRACEPSAAQALVSIPRSSTQPSSFDESASSIRTTDGSARDADLQRVGAVDPHLNRANRLLFLHETVKLAYSRPHDGSSLNAGRSSNALSTLRDSRSSVRKAALSLGFEKHINNPSEGPAQNDKVDLANSSDDNDELAAWS